MPWPHVSPKCWKVRSDSLPPLDVRYNSKSIKNNHMNILNNIKIIYDDIDYLVMIKSFLNINILFAFFGVIYTVNKLSHESIKANKNERNFILSSIGELTSFGVKPEDLPFRILMRDFCEALSDRDGFNYHFFFCQSKPRDVALASLDSGSRKEPR